MPAPKQVTDDQIMDVFAESDELVLTTTEISDVLPISRRGVLNRLDALAEEGTIQKKSVGGKTIVWYPSDRVSQ